MKPLAVSLAAAAVASLAMVPIVANACGGTFCDAGPQVMPVDQSGENILFWIDNGEGGPHTEAHIQIQYEGDPDRFAWLVPVSQVPEVLVGSQALFSNMLAGTGPTITVNTRFDGDCGFAGVGLGCGAVSLDSSVGFADSGAGTFGGEEDGGEGPQILDRGFAGAFEYVVLTGDNVDVIVDWLDAAGYAQDPDAPPILQEYLDDDFVFVAFKLRSGVGVDEIHPLAIRYPGVEPCIPIRLTRIAATDDMAIRAFFLGSDRAVPQNWPHVELNLAKLDWLGAAASSYLELVGLAIDEAGGRAFVTEYAGTDAVVTTSGINGAKWDGSVFVDLPPVEVVSALADQELLLCSNGNCDFFHPQVRPVLQRYLPAPEGMDEEAFWSDLFSNIDSIDPVAWDTQPGLAAELDERIFVPGQHAVDMLVDATYLTRMFTLISPHEMIEDPLFHETSSLGTVDNNITTTRVFSCDEGPDWIEFDDGRQVALEAGVYPQFADMPSAQRIERVPMVGPAQVEADNLDEINDLIEASNHDQLVGPAPWNCSISRLRPEAMLTMFALFGLAWFQRAPRRRG
ncbi:DUF2330 domain-containing protein [Enhygromyxa salina]|uniref:DUF2330 domain-containing protein n=1 Tax=Enhygromyxa salina TaxID=215803 RepID=UPI001FD3395F|nr:DUF2330 domain-containing protein [Enhygromyxa salina]